MRLAGMDIAEDGMDGVGSPGWQRAQALARNAHQRRN